MTQSKTIFITGGSSGIGRATAERLAQEGYTVYAGSRKGCQEVTNTSSGGSIHSLCVDVTQPATLQKAVATILQEKGTLYAVICNAGNGIAGSIEDTLPQEAAYQFNTNYYGVLNTIHACLPCMRQQGYGKIITMASVAAIAPIPYQAFYSSVKAAVLNLTEALSAEVKPFGIQCCCVLPGDVKTNFTNARKYTNASQLKESVYTERMKKAVQTMEKDEINGMSPDFIAQHIVRQIKAKKMAMRVTPGALYKFLTLLLKLLPARTKMFFIGKMY